MIPSLLQIPSAVSDSKLHSVLPNNGKGDFTFDRSTGATRINRDGLIEEVGYFSSELVQNGNFSELGDTVIVNGDMSLSGNITLDINSLGWNTPDTATSNAFISEHKLTIERLNGDARLYATNGVNTRNVLTVGKTYKLVFDIVENDGCTSFFYYRGGDYVSISDLTLGTKTIYFTAQTNQLFIFRNGTNNSSISIDNVSVKQVDPNDRWALGTDVEYGNSFIKMNNSAALAGAQQTNVITSGVQCRVTFTVQNYVSGTVNLRHPLSQSVTANGTYVFEGAANDTKVLIRGNAVTNNFEVTNISVVEVQGDRPRLTYDITNGVVEEKPHLLLEPSATNLITFSENFTNNWTLLGASITTNQITSPDGNTKGGLLQSTGTGTALIEPSGLSLTIGVTYTYSVFVKKGNNQWVRLAHITSSSTGCWFDLDNGVLGTVNSTSATIDKYPNGWYRITNTFVATSTNTPRSAFIGICDNDGSTNAGSIGKNVYIWGAMLEQQSYATSYIPTAGTTITRAAETCNNSKPSVNSTEGVLYGEINIPQNIADNVNIAVSDGTNTEYVKIIYLPASSTLRGEIQGSGNTVTVNDTSFVLGSYSKVAVSYKSGEFKLYVNGSQIGNTLTGHTLPTGLDTVSFDRGNAAAFFYGKVKGLAVYNEALSESQLMQLTGVTASSIYSNFVTRTASFTVEALNEVKKVIDNL